MRNHYMDLNCAPEKRGRLVSSDLLRTEVRIIHIIWPSLVSLVLDFSKLLYFMCDLDTLLNFAKLQVSSSFVK